MVSIAWLIAAVLLLLLEAATVALVSIWFAAGALAALIVSLCNGPIWLQCTVFLVVSGGLLALARPLMRKYFTAKLTPTNMDSLPGTEGVVTAPIDNLAAAGTVKLGAMEWTARSTDGNSIPAGARIRVDRIEGVKVFVSPVPTPVGKQ